MTSIELKTCLNIINENFGSAVSTVAKELYSITGVSLKSVVLTVKDRLTEAQVKKSIITLISHGIVGNVSQFPSDVLYRLDLNSVLHLLYKPIILESIQSNFGLYSMAMVKLLFDNGCYSLEKLLQETIASFPHHISLNSHIFEDMKKIIEANLIEIVENSNLDENSKKIDKEKFLEIFSEFMRHFHDPSESRKRTFKEAQNISFNDVLIRCSMQNLCCLVVEDNFINLFRNLYDELAASIVKAILAVQHHKNQTKNVFEQFPVTLEDIVSNIPTFPYADSQTISAYLSCLSTQNTKTYVKVVSDKFYDGYVLDTQNIMTKLCQENIFTIISERYGMPAKRIYHLLLSKSYLEQKQISDLSMTPFKEAKEILYSMYEDGFIDVQTIPRTPDANPLTSIFLFRVNFNRCVLETIQYCKTFSSNIIEKRLEISEDIRKLLEKNVKTKQLFNHNYAPITMTDLNSKEDKINQYLNHGEKVELKDLQNSITKLDYAQVNISKCLLLLNTFCSVNIPNSNQPKNV